ncbi:hypothetical protein TSST111916_17770 [Tsukamurella strandjordii]|uniref:hypothetical protein n=1 Tax=Tsukamurella TaxID=2060 RepID=UPI001C7D7610|nr:hypothetical protein [Tsukamurella sp. TY48]GIZ97173.1 hypothetical protein TTY48_17850 [Tsukamurella sp. TY48]
MIALTTASNETARLSSYQVARYLLDYLGPTLTAYIANVRSRALPGRWALEPTQPGAAEPSNEQARRLRTAHTLLLAIEQNDGDQTAPNWLISANPRLDDRTPAALIREDHAPAVLRAAEAFIADHTNA